MIGVKLMVAVMMLAGAATQAAGPARQTIQQYVKERVGRILDEAQSAEDFDKAKEEARQLNDQVIALAPAMALEAFRESDFCVRLVDQLSQAPESVRKELLRYLRANDELAHDLVFLIRPGDKPSRVYALLDRMRKERGEKLNKYATLTAAICVVHDRALERHLNENRAKSPDPVALFDYYTKNEGRMYFGLRGVPAEILIYVVDVTASVDELNWAVSRYAGDAKVGARFFDIKYDWNSYRTGARKRVTEAGFNLPNILEYGGVCIDQAYFATTVGKAIGVPTAIAVAESGEVGHAWVGFLQAQGNRGWWNFDIGRYEAYKGIRGNVLDPQTRQEIPDSYVSLLGEMIGSRPADRQNGVALADAAMRMFALAKEGGSLDAAALPENVIALAKAKARVATVQGALDLLELAIRQSPGERACWLPVAQFAQDGKLTLEQKKHWSEVLNRVCGSKYPDFALAILTPMVRTIEDPKEQDKLWNAAFGMFQGRADLAAAVRMSQAANWEAHQKPELAGPLYLDVVERYANAGPFALTALKKCEQALVETKRADKVLLLYEQVWTAMKQPKDSAFVQESNWYKVGDMLASRLERAGEQDKAQQVRGILEGKAGATRVGASQRR